MALVAISLSAGSIGCRHPGPKLIDPNTTVVRLQGTNVFTPPVPGYFVPDATYLRILDRLSEKEVYGK